MSRDEDGSLGRGAGALFFCASVAGCNTILGIGPPTVQDAGHTAAEASISDAATGSEATNDASSDSTAAVSSDGASPSDGPHEGTAASDARAEPMIADGGDAARDGDGDAPPVGDGSSDGGSGCTTSPCTPFALLPEDAGYAPARLAQDATYLYWTDPSGGRIGRTNKVTGETRLVQQLAFLNPEGIAVDETNIYWTDNAPGVWRCPKAGCAAGPARVASTEDTPLLLALDAINVYWTVDQLGEVRAAPKDGVDAAFVTLWRGDASPQHITTDGQWIWTTMGDGRAVRMNADGGAATAFGIAGLSPGGGISTDNTAVYWTVENNTGGTVNFMGKADSTSRALASSQPDPIDVASDGTTLYWLNYGRQNGTVSTCPIQACSSPQMLASNLAAPWALLIDDDFIYWTEKGGQFPVGSIWRLPRR